MPITRTPINDDDGSGTTGTVIDNAWKQEFYNQIDGLLPSGTWTPIDMSGAAMGLTIYAREWARAGRIVMVQVHLVYPGNASPLAARLGGLPFANIALPPGVGAGGFYSTQPGQHHLYQVPAGSTEITISNPTTGAARTNSELSGATLLFAGVYLTT